MGDEAKPLQLDDLLAVVLDQFAGVAWQKLGLQPDPITGRIEADLDQARRAIDVVADMAKHLDSQLDEEDRREVHNLIRNLRLNYVQKTKEGP